VAEVVLKSDPEIASGNDVDNDTSNAVRRPNPVIHGHKPEIIVGRNRPRPVASRIPNHNLVPDIGAISRSFNHEHD